ncbi:hypothetical protein ABPG72_007088 [Tetrahymena utriculariae]
MADNIMVDAFAVIPQTIGSKDSIIVQVQSKTDFSQKFNTNFNVNSTQNGDNTSLLLDNLDAEEDLISSIAATVIAKNPAFSSQECQEYPLFQFKAKEQTKCLLQAQAQQYTVTFNVNDKTKMKNYVCLSYNLTQPKPSPQMVQTTPGQDTYCLLFSSIRLKCLNYIRFQMSIHQQVYMYLIGFQKQQQR